MDVVIERPARRTVYATVGTLLLAAMLAAQVASGPHPSPVRLTSVVVLLLAGCAVAFAAADHGVRRSLTAFCAAACAGYAAEWVGIRTGIPFGEYRYTGVLWPAPGGVPLIVTLAWGGMGLAAHAIASRVAGIPLRATPMGTGSSPSGPTTDVPRSSAPMVGAGSRPPGPVASARHNTSGLAVGACSCTSGPEAEAGHNTSGPEAGTCSCRSGPEAGAGHHTSEVAAGAGYRLPGRVAGGGPRSSAPVAGSGRFLSTALVGAFALTAWDLFLDPQMLRLGLWVWAEPGPYRGVPISNLAGWLVVSFLVMALIGWVFRQRPTGRGTGLVALYTAMAVMETIGFAFVFRPPDRLVAVVGGATMGLFAVLAWVRRGATADPDDTPTPGTTPDTASGNPPGTTPDTAPGNPTGTTSDSTPDSTPGNPPGTASGNPPGATPGTTPGRPNGARPFPSRAGRWPT